MPAKARKNPKEVSPALRDLLKEMLERSRKGDTLLPVGAYIHPQPEAAGVKATVEMNPAAVTFRMRPSVNSAIYKLPEESTAIPVPVSEPLPPR